MNLEIVKKFEEEGYFRYPPDGVKSKKIKCRQCHGTGYFTGMYQQTACDYCHKGHMYFVKNTELKKISNNNNSSMNEINIGIGIDLEKLLRTRLLIQASSGGGKSGAIRKLCEEASGKVQIIALDIEGEMATLREKFDFALVGKEGDIPINIRYAEALAHKLLETNISTIIDLYELERHERIQFVKLFIDAMINAPKKLWHSCLVIVDEAHQFCPESSKCESTAAVIDLCTRGRKRGFCAVLATQRLSKLHKDAAAECMNKLIGRTGLDIDRDRAGKELGWRTNNESLQLRNLKEREFYAFGPAISNDVQKFRTSTCKTTFPETGGIVTVTKTPNAVKKIIDKLDGIPLEAENELKDREDMRREITKLRGELTRAKNEQVIDETEIEKRVELRTAEIRYKANHWLGELEGKYKKGIKERDKRIEDLEKLIVNSRGILNKYDNDNYPNLSIIDGNIPENILMATPNIKRTEIEKPKRDFEKTKIFHTKNDSLYNYKAAEEGDNNQIGKCESSILTVLIQRGKPCSKRLIALQSGYSSKSGGFNNSLSKLRQMGYIQGSGEAIYLTIAGKEIMKEIDVLPSGKELIEYWINKLPLAEAKILSVVSRYDDNGVSKKEIAVATGYSETSGGFNNAISRLNTLELIDRKNGLIYLAKEMF